MGIIASILLLTHSTKAPKPSKKESNQSRRNSPASKPESGWKLHRIEKHNLTFHLPNGWTPETPDDGGVWQASSNSPLVVFHIKVSRDWSFKQIGVDGYADQFSETKIKNMAELTYKNVSINNCEKDYTISGQRAVNTIYSGDLSGVRIASHVIQTVRDDELITFSFVTPASSFTSLHNSIFMKVLDSISL